MANLNRSSTTKLCAAEMTLNEGSHGDFHSVGDEAIYKNTLYHSPGRAPNTARLAGVRSNVNGVQPVRPG